MINAKNITRDRTRSKMGGLADKFYYAFQEDILRYPLALLANFATAGSFGALVTIPADDIFVMRPGKYFHEVPCTVEEGQIKSTMTGLMGSRAWEQSYSGSENGNNPELEGMLAYCSNDGVIILAPELNGNLKVIGNELYRAMLETAEETNGGKVSDGNPLKFSFKAAASTPCPRYLGPVSALLEPAVAGIDPVITINAFTNLAVGAADKNIVVTTTNVGTPITYATSDAAIATIVNNKVHAVSAGTVLVIVSQPAGVGADGVAYNAKIATQSITITA